jgi:hypothetical protein
MNEERPNYRSCIKGGAPEAVALWHRVCDELEQEEAEWIAMLRSKGVKAAHPDDGWVDRRKNTVLFTYPQFNDGAAVGDLVALGWPQHDKRQPQHRIVRLTGFARTTFGSREWMFSDAEPQS